MGHAAIVGAGGQFVPESEMQAGGPIGLLLCSLSELGCTMDEHLRVHDGVHAVDILNMPYQRLRPWALE
eukprot:7344843-Alexandrium_andersonii.AAC.1